MKGITCGVSLPEELVMEIFSRLPVETLLRFKCASKSCCNMINSPEFVKLHIIRRSLDRNSGVILLHLGDSFLASFDLHHPQLPAVQLHHLNTKKLPSPRNKNPDLDNLFEDNDDDIYDAFPAEIIGISNGVVCFNKTSRFILYNPATRSSIQIPKVKVSCCEREVIYMNDNNEFGYDCVGDDYRILSVVKFLKGPIYSSYALETAIYSLKSSSWQKIENPPWTVLDFRSGGSVVANNSFYWVSSDKVIISFDLWSQTYGKMSFPTEVSSNIRLGVLKGRLHAIMSNDIGMAIWMLKEDHKWTLLFRCLESQPPWYSFWPLPCVYSRDGSKILVGLDGHSKSFICCDLNSQTTTTTVDILGLPKDAGYVTAVPWVESLVPLG